ncbi:hypothetical protein SAMN02745775_1308 [Falsiroseomonas stagni DSM 19981]|uniref:Uncharacterized protein n=2 Tax=Falsiroseomonas TaxID=2870713 RepID=A0A1I4FDP7_9PROT|nr:hypothetical protein SAMN02745775_1308 [Falsiroseomonas stagni DSM 19981]
MPAPLTVLEALLKAEASLTAELEAQLPARPATDRRAYESFIPSPEVIAIARLFFMLEEAGVSDEGTFRSFAQLHNDRINNLLEDPDYLKRWGLRADRIARAYAEPGPLDQDALNFVRHGAMALSGSAIARFLVEFCGKSEVFDALALLAELGAFEKLPGAHNATLYRTTGRLERAYRNYLLTVAAHLAPDPDPAPEDRSR